MICLLLDTTGGWDTRTEPKQTRTMFKRDSTWSHQFSETAVGCKHLHIWYLHRKAVPWKQEVNFELPPDVHSSWFLGDKYKKKPLVTTVCLGSSNSGEQLELRISCAGVWELKQGIYEVLNPRLHTELKKWCLQTRWSSRLRRIPCHFPRQDKLSPKF